MEIYDQHEQSERVRSWLKDNGTAIISGIVIGLAAIFGYHQWQGYQVNRTYTAAELYEASRGPGTGEPSAAADAARSQLRSEFPRSGYAVLAALDQAHDQIEAGDAEGARATIAWARDQAREPALQALIGLRLARLQLAAGSADDALASLDSLPDAAGFAAERAELRGDVLVALDRVDQARAAYLEAETAGPVDPSRLAMKLAEYGAAENAGGADVQGEGP